MLEIQEDSTTYFTVFGHFEADVTYMYVFKRQYSLFFHVLINFFIFMYIYITRKSFC